MSSTRTFVLTFTNTGTRYNTLQWHSEGDIFLHRFVCLLPWCRGRVRHKRATTKTCECYGCTETDNENFVLKIHTTRHATTTHLMNCVKRFRVRPSSSRLCTFIAHVFISHFVQFRGMRMRHEENHRLRLWIWHFLLNESKRCQRFGHSTGTKMDSTVSTGRSMVRLFRLSQKKIDIHFTDEFMIF